MIENALKIQGWMSQQELQWIALAARGSDTIIEIGCYKGRSTRCWVDNTPGVVHVVDPWSSMGIKDDGTVDEYADFRVYDEFRINLADANNLFIHRGTFADVNPNELPLADLIFIDGDHRREHVVHDIAKSRNLLKRGGILAGHDYGAYNWPAVEQVVDAIFPQRYITDTIWWVKL